MDLSPFVAVLFLITNFHLDFLPPVNIVSSETLSSLAGCKTPCKLLGLEKNKTIYLNESLDLNSSFGRSVVFHELVHVYQEQKYGVRKIDDCFEFVRREQEAYFLQNLYLSEIENSPQRALFVFQPC